MAPALRALRSQRQRIAELRLVAGPRWEDHDLVFPSNVGTPISGTNVLHEFKRVLARAGLPTTFRLHDLRHVLDQSGVARASLLAWSMGGNEITSFAGRYPELVAGLVYLDGGYDWSDTTFAAALGGVFDVLQPRESDLGSLDAYRAWYRATWLGDTVWTSGLEAYLRATISGSDDGAALDSVMPDAVHDALFHTLATWSRDYGRVRPPALALYAPTFLSPEAATSGAAHDFEYKVRVPFRRASIERIQHELAGVDVREIANTSHMSIGVADPRALATMVGDFLVAAQA